MNTNHINLFLKQDIKYNLKPLDYYNKQLKHDSVGYVHTNIQKSTSRYRANYSESKEQ